MRPVQLVLSEMARLLVDVDFAGIPEAVIHDREVYVLMDAVPPAPTYRLATSTKTRDKTLDEVKAELREKLQKAKAVRLEADIHVNQAKDALAELGEVIEDTKTPSVGTPVVDAPAEPMTTKSGVGFLKVS